MSRSWPSRLNCQEPVIFRGEDFFQATRKAVAERRYKNEPLYLCVSYDTDLLAFESVVPYTACWIEFARNCSDLLIEVRTKSAHYDAIAQLKPTPQVILAWTLSPTEVAQTYEKGTPGLARRIAAINEAIRDGWRVRLCFDPILRIKDWKEKYTECVAYAFSQLPAEKILDVSVGTFRMNATYFKRIRKQRDDSDILYYPFEVQNERVNYPSPEREEMLTAIVDKLGQYVPKERIALSA